MKKVLSVFLTLFLVITCIPKFVIISNALDPQIRIFRNGAYLATTYTSLITANTAAQTGDIIELNEATFAFGMIQNTTYPYGITLSKNVTIRGPENGYATLIPDVNNWDVSYNSDKSHRLINCSGSGMTIENIIIDCSALYSTVSIMHGLNTSCTDLVLNNVIITGCKSSCINYTSGTTIKTTANNLYCKSMTNTIGSYATIAVAAGTFIFNSGVIHGALTCESGGTITNNSLSNPETANTMGPYINRFPSVSAYMSDTFAAGCYPNLGYAYKSSFKTFIKNNAASFQKLADRYTLMSPMELVGSDPIGNVHLTTVAGLKTISSDYSLTATTNTLNAIITKGNSIKANAVNTLSAISYSIDGAAALALPSFDSATQTYYVTLPIDTSPTAEITLTASPTNVFGDVTNNAPVTLVDGCGTAAIDGWAYAANPQLRSYTVVFTVPKLTVSFAAGVNDSLSGTASLAVFYNSLTENLTLPSCIADLGYNFSGWNPVLPAAITESATYTAQFTKDLTQWATVAFNAGTKGALSGTTNFEVLKNTAWSNITPPAVTANAPYTFVGWDAVFPANITQDAVFSAVYEIIREIVLDDTDDAIRFPQEGDTPSVLIEYLIQNGDFSTGDTLEVKDSLGAVISGNTPLATGMFLSVNGVSSYSIILSGDVNADSLINAVDKEVVVKASVGLQELGGDNFTAADINNDGVVDSVDAFMLDLYVSGNYKSDVLH